MQTTENMDEAGKKVQLRGVTTNQRMEATSCFWTNVHKNVAYVSLEQQTPCISIDLQGVFHS